MRGAHDPRRTVDRAPEVIVIAPLDHSRMQPTAHAQRNTAGRRRIGQRLLHVQRRSERVQRIVEDGMDSIAGHLHHRAVAMLDRAARERVVRGQRLRHPSAVLLPQRGAALDVGKKKGRDCGWVVHAKAH